MIEIKKEPGQQLAKVKDLHRWEKNPKEHDRVDYQRLKRQYELGEHSTLLVMPDGTVLGGNTRLDLYVQLKKEFAKVIVVDVKEDGDRWAAYVDGQKAPKTFDSREQAMLEYALSHNDMIGRYNEEKLAELLLVTPIESEVYKVSSVVRPVEDVVFESAGTNPEDRPQDVDTTDTDKLDAFMNGAIKQIVLYFDNPQYEDVVPRLEALRQKYEVENNTELFMILLRLGEQDGAE